MQPKDFDEMMADSEERIKRKAKKEAAKVREPRFKHIEIPGITCDTPEARSPFYVANTAFRFVRFLVLDIF